MTETSPMQNQHLIVAAAEAGTATEVLVLDAASGAEVRNFEVFGTASVVAGRVTGRAVIAHNATVQDALTGETIFETTSSKISSRICALGGDELPVVVGIKDQRAVVYDALTGEVLSALRHEDLIGDERGPDYSTSVIRTPHIAAVGGPPERERVVVGYHDELLDTTSLLAWEVRRPATGWLKRLWQAFQYVPYEVVPMESSPPNGYWRGKFDLLAVGENVVAAAVGKTGVVEITQRLPQDRHFRHISTLNGAHDPERNGRRAQGEWGRAHAIAVGNVDRQDVVAVSWERRLGVYAIGQDGVETDLLMSPEHEPEHSQNATHLTIGTIQGRTSLLAGYGNGALRAWDLRTHERLLDTRLATRPVTTLAII